MKVNLMQIAKFDKEEIIYVKSGNKTFIFIMT